jgi:histidyl-tRNA synthetase
VAKYQSLPGMKDFVGDAAQAYWWVIDTCRDLLLAAGAHEVKVPLLEEAATFDKTSGDTSDVVEKEMYTFTDRGDRKVALRPEFTQGLLRAYVEHGMKVWPHPVRLVSTGPAFRYGRPQKGRYREFTQVDYEILGSDDPLVDAEAIQLLYLCFRAIGLRELSVHVSSLGNVESRQRYKEVVRGRLEPVRKELTADSQRRLDRNPLRVLDDKVDSGHPAVKALPPLLDYLDDDSRRKLDVVQQCLADWGVPFSLDPAIVRGLDYYVGTAFEVHHGEIGTQSALCGGGRYDGLIAALGGEDVPGIGWALGVERALLAMEAEGLVEDLESADPADSFCDLFVAGEGADGPRAAAGIAAAARGDGGGVTVLFSLKQLDSRKANAEARKAGARWLAWVAADGGIVLHPTDRPARQRKLSRGQFAALIETGLPS